MNPSFGTIAAENIDKLIMEKDKADPAKTVITAEIKTEQTVFGNQ